MHPGYLYNHILGHLPLTPFTPIRAGCEWEEAKAISPLHAFTVPLLLPEMSCQFIQLSNYKIIKIFSINCLKSHGATLPPLSYLFQSLGVS